MRVCTHRGLLIAILTRNEHCPPHAHVGNGQWDARFKFSFWHNGIDLWDVVPVQHEPNAAVLEELRLVLKQPAYLRRARELWWSSTGTACLDNLQWDWAAEKVVSPKDRRTGAVAIQSVCFDAPRYRTILQLAGQSSPLEIEL